MSETAAEKRRVGLDLTTGPIFSNIIRFAVPIIIASLIQQIYGMVDLAIIGKFCDSNGTVGVSAGGELADLLLPVATAFSTAAQIYIAQLMGANNREKTQKAIGTLFTLMAVLSVVFLLATIAFYKPILELLNCPESAFENASTYMIIVAFGLPAVFGYNAVCGVLRGMGESKRPLIFVTVAAVVNIVADTLLVAVFHLDVAGTAIATILSQYGSFAAAVIFMLRRNDVFKMTFTPAFFKPDSESLAVMLRLGVPLFVKTMLIHFAMAWVSANVNAYGLTASSTNYIGTKLQKFVNSFTISMDSAGASIIAQNLGAKKYDRVKKTMWMTMGLCVAVATVFSVLSFFAPRLLFSIFTSDAEVLEMGQTYMRIMCVMYYLSAIAGALQSVVTGSGFASLGFVIGVSDGIVCRIGLSILFAWVLDMGVVGFFWGAALARSLGCLICLAYYLSGKWKTRELIPQKRHA